MSAVGTGRADTRIGSTLRRGLGLVLLGAAVFCLYLGASGSLLGMALGRSGADMLGLVVCVLAWIPFALFLLLGLMCSPPGTGPDRLAITVLTGSLLTLFTWLSVGLMLLSPTVDAALPPGHDYPAFGRVGLLACPFLLILLLPAGLRLRRMSRAPGMPSGTVARTSQSPPKLQPPEP